MGSLAEVRTSPEYRRSDAWHWNSLATQGISQSQISRRGHNHLCGRAGRTGSWLPDPAGADKGGYPAAAMGRSFEPQTATVSSNTCCVGREPVVVAIQNPAGVRDFRSAGSWRSCETPSGCRSSRTLASHHAVNLVNVMSWQAGRRDSTDDLLITRAEVRNPPLSGGIHSFQKLVPRPPNRPPGPGSVHPCEYQLGYQGDGRFVSVSFSRRVSPRSVLRPPSPSVRLDIPTRGAYGPPIGPRSGNSALSTDRHGPPLALPAGPWPPAAATS